MSVRDVPVPASPSTPMVPVSVVDTPLAVPINVTLNTPLIDQNQEGIIAHPVQERIRVHQRAHMEPEVVHTAKRALDLDSTGLTNKQTNKLISWYQK